MNGPKFPEVHVKIVDLLNCEDPWQVINRCMFAAKRAGVSAGNRMLFVHEALSSGDFGRSVFDGD
jgi:hypothetical protein